MLSALAGVVAVPAAMIACNDIIGLSDYQRVECTGLVCDGGGLPDTSTIDATDGTDGGGRGDASGTQPVRWAAWPMPNYVPPDASPDSVDNPLSYSATTGGFVDDVTGLVWAHPMPSEAGSPMPFEQAKALCDRLPNGPWRLPSRIELVTLLDLSKQGTAKIAATFEGTLPVAHWTSSEVRPFEPERQYWVVDFGSGGLAKLHAGTSAAVRCVKDRP